MSNCEGEGRDGLEVDLDRGAVGGGDRILPAVPCAWAPTAAALARCAERKASMSAQRLLNAVLTCFLPEARCLLIASREVEKRSSRCRSSICVVRRRLMSSIVNAPAVGCRGSTMSKRWESVKRSQSL